MKKIYLSGPMTGLPGYNFHAFHAEAERLRKLGYYVINPAEINAGNVLKHHEYLRADIKALCDCDTIALLPGWNKSHGAVSEMKVAKMLKIQAVMASDILEKRDSSDEGTWISEPERMPILHGKPSRVMFMPRSGFIPF